MSSATMARRKGETSEAAIFTRVWDDESNGLTPTVARHVLKLSDSIEFQVYLG